MKFSTLTSYYPTLDEEYLIYFWADGRKRAEMAAFLLEKEGHTVSLVDISREALREAEPLEGFVFYKPLLSDASTSFLAIPRSQWQETSTPVCRETEFRKHYTVVKLWRGQRDEAPQATAEKGVKPETFVFDLVGPEK